MSDSSQPDGFDDLEEMDHVEVERMKGDFERFGFGVMTGEKT